jgi:VWFA-related protein
MFFMGLLLMLLLAVPAFAQEAVFHSDVTWVRVDVQVWDRNRVVNGLRKDDFIVYDEDRPQPVLYFGHETEPLDVLLLLDVSGSMHRYLEQMASTAREALHQLNPDDRVGVMLFARRAQVHEELTSDRAKVEAELKDAVNEKGLGSGTLINASILEAAGYLGKQVAAIQGQGPRPGRRAILMMTDNMGLNYQVPDEKVLDGLFDADTVLNAIVVGRGERPRPPKPGQYVNPDFTPSDVFHLAGETGGEAVKADRADATFRWMMESIRSRYSLQYRVPDAAAGSFRRIKVDLSPNARERFPHAILRARSGYKVKQ